MKTTSYSTINVLLIFVWVVSACTPSTPAPSVENKPSPARSSTSPPPTETPQPRPTAERIGIRTVDGAAEFYNTVTGEKFTPRGVNYVDFYATGNELYEDRLLATNVYNPERVRTAFRHLHDYGYNTVRIFFDNCSSGPNCFGKYGGRGLNPGYLDNMVDVMNIAAEQGIYIIFTANTAPGEGGYWQDFDDEIYNTNRLPGFESYQNADWLHPAGVKMKSTAWRDLMSGMAERDAPFETVLGWQLTNEFWLWKNNPPLSWTSGMVTISNGQTYDMADPEQKRQMITDGTLYFMETIVAIIKEYDPNALTTMGFYAPQFPNPTGIGADTYVDTAPLMDKAPIDFWDFHSYADMDIDIVKQAENFGMVGYEEKPVLMGETGMGHAFVPSAQSAASITAQWFVDSCKVGFDGWLYWGYYPWPADMGGKPWAPLESDEFIFDALAPRNWADPCSSLPELETRNISHGKPVRSSGQTGDGRAVQAVDGSAREWNAGNYPPQWIEIDLEQPSTVGQVGFTVGQWPPGYTHHQVWARLADGRYVLLADFNGFTTVDMSLTFKLPIPVENVTTVRFLQLTSPSWAGYREVEVVSAPPTGREACFAKSGGTLRLMNYPAQEAREVGALKSGDEINIAGFYTDANGVRWARVGTNAWVKAEGLAPGQDCESADLTVSDPGPRLVPVTFNVTVPEGTPGEVFIGAFLPGTEFPAWIPWMILLEKKSGTLWSVTLDLPVGTEVQYVYTRSSWETIERPPGCPGNMPPRKFTVEDVSQMQRDDSVTNWRDLDCQQ
ncbi:MAG: cellulase family glycosylhydrolase [Chloroflexota bacterium]